MITKKIYFFSAMRHDIETFEFANKDKNFAFTFDEESLSLDVVNRANNHDAICIFVNDIVDDMMMEKISEMKMQVVFAAIAVGGVGIWKV